MGTYLYRWLSAILVITAVYTAVCESQSSRYQTATITGVALHPNAPGESSVARYDVTLKMGNNVYVVLYTPPQGQNTVEYAAGMEVLVLVDNDSIRFSKLGTSGEAPIERREALSQSPSRKQVSWDTFGEILPCPIRTS